MFIGKNKVEYQSPIYQFQSVYDQKTTTYFPYASVIQKNNFYIKRDDLIPYCFGGNKARMVLRYFEDIDEIGSDAIVTYGSSDSNLCRIIANMANTRGISCYIISPEETSHQAFNAQMSEMFGATVITCKVEEVHDTIERQLKALQDKGFRPYFIGGGGHGVIGTDACVDCYEEILDYEKERRLSFDYIFLASGTGTTQSGLVAGKMIHHGKENIVGISVARKNPHGIDITCESVQGYYAYKEIRFDMESGELSKKIRQNTVFLDEYTGEGYGKGSKEIEDVVSFVMKNYGIPLDQTYTGKAFTGMLKYLNTNDIHDKNILFLHTGGTPLYFDYLEKMRV